MGQPRFVGNPPDWHANPVNDKEYLWTLNRMFHWHPLLWAHVFTGDARYARKVVEELSNWIDTCPRPCLSRENFDGVTPWRSLEAGIRMFDSWSWVLEFLRGTEFMAPDLWKRLSRSVEEHGEVLYKICPQYWPEADHNHYLMENLGLLVIATEFPEIPQSAVWQTHACSELERCAKAQISPEGGQIEGCPHYHNGSVSWFARAAMQARANGAALSEEYMASLERMIAYSVYAFRPSGTTVPWGDSDATVDDAARAALYGYLAAGISEPMAIIGSMAGKAPLVQAALEAAHEIQDLEETLAFIGSLDGRTVNWPVISWQKTLKQVAFRSDWSSSALSVFFACRTPVCNGHSHIDPAGFDFAGLGRPLVVDPGRFTYREDADRRNFKSAKWHNTLAVNDCEPFEYLDTWRYGPQKEGRILQVIEKSGLMAVVAEHDNYLPAVHRRAVIILEGECLLVLDEVSNAPAGSSVQLYYHLDFEKTMIMDHRVEAYGDDVSLIVLFSGNLTCDALPGRVSDRLDVARPSTRLRLEDREGHGARRRYATVLVPYRTACGVPEASPPEIIGDGGDWACRFMLPGRRHSIYWRNLADISYKTEHFL